MTDMMLAQTGIGEAVRTFTDAEVFAFVVPFLLAIAIVYGLLEHFDIPNNKSARSLIAILSGFLVLPLGNVIFPFLEGMVLGVMAIVAAVLALVIMAEATGIKAGEGEHIWESHPKWTGAVFIAIALIIFVSSGGLELVGLGNFRFSGNLSLAFFLVVIALGVWWIAGEE